MAPTPPISLPPVTAQYASTLQKAGSQLPAAPSSFQFTRASDGTTRVDSGSMSVISNPAAAHMIVLNHVNQTATIQPTPPPAPPAPAPAMPQVPGFAPPGLPAMPQVPGVKVEDLGKTVVQGQEVQGKRFVIPPPAMPKLPGLPTGAVPKLPGLPAAAVPKLPGLPTAAVPKPPQMPGPPPAPPPPQSPTTAEVWTSTSMTVPMLTKMTGSFGQLTQICHSAVPGEPHPSAFQIPTGYKVVGGS